MAYRYDGPSLAAGGKLVKKGSIAKRKSPTSKKPASMFTPEEWAERLAPGWDERGWHGGGMCEVRKTQKTRPSKGNTWRGRQAHPSILRLTK